LESSENLRSRLSTFHFEISRRPLDGIVEENLMLDLQGGESRVERMMNSSSMVAGFYTA
jgi:hypothetical protein